MNPRILSTRYQIINNVIVDIHRTLLCRYSIESDDSSQRALYDYYHKMILPNTIGKFLESHGVEPILESHFSIATFTIDCVVIAELTGPQLTEYILSVDTTNIPC